MKATLEATFGKAELRCDSLLTGDDDPVEEFDEDDVEDDPVHRDNNDLLLAFASRIVDQENKTQ